MDLSQFWVKNYNWAIGTASKILMNYQDAEDAVSRAFIKFQTAYHKFEHRSDERTWFYRILVNECYMILRKKGYEHKKSIEYSIETHDISVVGDESSGTEHFEPRYEPRTERALEARDLIEKAQLENDPDWALLRAQIVEQKTLDDIAREHNISLPKLKSKLHRLKDKCKRKVEQQCLRTL